MAYWYGIDPQKVFAMALFPKIESPCPYRDDLNAIMQGDTCTMCERDVFDLTHMSDNQRQSFLASCSGEVCVSYRLPLARTLAAAAIASSAVLAPAGAAAQVADSLYCYNDEDIEIIVGGLRKGSEAEILDLDMSLAELPRVYENTETIEAALDEIFGMNMPPNDKAAGVKAEEDGIQQAVLPESLKTER